MTTVWISLAGGFGAVSRFVVDGLIRQRSSVSFPWATMLINVSGSFLLGVLTGLVLFRGSPTDLQLILGTGYCGGYTTFSTASFETVRLAQRGSAAYALANGLGTLGLAIAAAAAGLAVVR
ncbi:MAG: fluoride efflux transporter CrcB [Jatrophihabitans sp.]